MHGISESHLVGRTRQTNISFQGQSRAWLHQTNKTHHHPAFYNTCSVRSVLLLPVHDHPSILLPMPAATTVPHIHATHVLPLPRLVLFLDPAKHSNTPQSSLERLPQVPFEIPNGPIDPKLEHQMINQRQLAQSYSPMAHRAGQTPNTCDIVGPENSNELDLDGHYWESDRTEL